MRTSRRSTGTVTLDDVAVHAGKPVFLEVLSFLKGWLESHIVKSDRDLATFLNTVTH